MGGLTRGYFIQRLLMFFLTIWIGVSLTFAIPRLSGSDPTTAMLLTMMNARGYVENADAEKNLLFKESTDENSLSSEQLQKILIDDDSEKTVTSGTPMVLIKCSRLMVAASPDSTALQLCDGFSSVLLTRA